MPGGMPQHSGQDGDAPEDVDTMVEPDLSVSQQEEKYTAELNDALRQYAELEE